MTKPAFWRAVRDWAGVVGAFAMVLALTFAPSLLRDTSPRTHPEHQRAAASPVPIEMASAPEADAPMKSR